MKIAVFDIGGTLRRIRLPNKQEFVRDYSAIHLLYKTLCESPDWKVIILTLKNKGVTKEEAWEDFKNLNLPEPDDFIVVYKSKIEVLRELKPDILFDDDDRWIEFAKTIGIFPCRVI